MDRAAFGLFAKLEEHHWWFRGRRRLYLPLLEHVLRRDLARAPTDLQVADVGCGVGGFLEPLRRFGRVLGVELDEPAVVFAHERGRTAMIVGRCDELPVPDGSLDLITLWDVIEHTEDDLAVLAAARRALRPGGHVAVSVPAYQFLYANNDRVAHHHRRYTRGGLRRRLVSAGLQVRKATYVNATLAPLIIPAVLALKLKERLLGPSEDTANNLTVRTPRVLDRALGAVMASERHWLPHASAPFGHSIVAVARRPPEG